MILFSRKILFPALFIANLLSINGIAQKLPVSVKNTQKWTVSPFGNKAFIENKGQFNTDFTVKDKVLYSVTLGELQLYFTAHGIVYRDNNDVEFTKDNSQKPVTHYLNADWENSNPAVTVSAEQKEEEYYTYAAGANKTIKANGFKRLTYHNLYPGIDVVYYFPTGKDGFEYDIIAHPGADISLMKLNYDGANTAFIDPKGNTIITSLVGTITDHTPQCNYEGGGSLKVTYKVNGTVEGFKIAGNYDKNKTIVIDPWTTDPKFTSLNDKAYDLDYDNNGNVYVYGGYKPFQLVKLNSNGTPQWLFAAGGIDPTIFGGLAVDRKNGTSYLVEGASAGGAKVLKVNSAGALVATSAADAKMNEMWRPLYNSCYDSLIIGAGGTNSKFQATIVDTSFTKFTNLNVLAANASGHSVVLAALDPSGTSCYMAMAKSAVIDPTHFNNSLVKLPLPSLSPTTYIVPDGFKFVELASINYVNGIGNTNGMNGMAASLNWLYLYDGGVLRRFNKITGAVNDSVKVTGSPYSWGGLDVDICDNVYAGSQKWISVYNSSMALADTITLPDTVFDVKVNAARQVVYACGKGFVKSVSVPFSPLSIASTNATCTCNGTATANLCGGADTSKVTYLWDDANKSTTQTITGLCGRQYKVIVTLGLCTPVKFVDSVTILQPNPLTSSITAKTNVKCHGGIGNATVTATGGAKPYTYLWSPSGGTQATADTLPAGKYIVSVTDSNKCSVTDTVIITQPPALIDTANNTTAHCGLSDGTATVVVSGGIKPYTYSWAAGGQTTITATSLAAGLYVITVTDSSGCTAKATTIIPDAGIVPVISGVTGETCNGQKIGTATITMIGGTAGYTYSWVPSAQTNATATNLPSATYTASVTDANGCIATDTVTITQPQVVSIDMKPGNVSCFGGANGSVTASVTGGTGPYTYSWSPVVSTDSTISSLMTGTYSVNVSDVNGCKAGDSITITQPTNGLMVVIIKQSPVTCTGGKNGSGTVGASGGTGPYTYSWSPPVVSADSTADSLAAGSYNATATDAHGCSTSITVVITQPSKALGDTIISTNNKCDGDSNGTAYVVASGGTLPYTYAWSYAGSVSDTITGLASGTYNVTITDSNKCTGSGSVTITQPPALVVSFVNTQTACNSNNGTATAVIGGSGKYTYIWNNGETAAKDSGLASGPYTVTVTDSAGCKTKVLDTVPHSQPPTATASMLPATCDSTNGSAIAHGVGGTGAYTYLWSPSGQTGDTAKRIGPGIYKVTVTDSNGCSDTAITIVGDSGVSAGFSTIKDISCNGLSDGSATATIIGATGPFTYVWSPGPQTNAVASNLGLGTYTVTITDVNKCTATDTITITQPAVLVATLGKVTNVKCFGDSNGSGIIITTGGTPPYKYLWTDGEKTDTATKFAAGSYTVTVTDANNCVATATVAVTQPTVLTVTTGTTAATCGANGSATATGHGGTTPYLYNWVPGGPGATISGISQGAYEVTVTDSNGCTDTASAIVIHSGQTANISASNNVKCFGASTGSATVSVIGGDTLLYGYAWSTNPVQTNATATNLTAGIDTVLVTYIANGCTDTLIDTITQPSKIILSIKDTVGCNANGGNSQVFVSGGIAPYTYSWAPSGGTNSTASLPSGTYTVTVTDSYSCPATATETIVVPVLSANFFPTPDTILGGEFVYFKNVTAGGSLWWWTFGNGNNSDTMNPYQQYITPGVYPVWLYVVNVKGCRDSVEKNVYVIDSLYIPNVFTPNGDGKNDVFHITAGNMKEYNLVIYNRWGEKLFESKSPNNDWSGTSDAGVKESEGTYYYILKATDYENKTYNLRGYVELIR